MCRRQTAFGLAEGALGGLGKPQRPPLLGLPTPQPPPSATLAWCPAAPLNLGQKCVSGRRQGRNSQARMLREPSWTGRVAALSRVGGDVGRAGQGEHSWPSPQDRLRPPTPAHTPLHIWLPSRVDGIAFCGQEGGLSQIPPL